MSLKPLAAFSLALTFLLQNALLGADAPSPSPSPTPTPAPGAAPSPSPVPSPAASPKEQKSQAPTTGAVIDGLSQADLNEAVNQLKANYINPASLTEQELNKATLQGLIDRLAPGVSIFPGAPQPPEESPFRAEILNEQIGYMRLGSITKGNLGQMDSTLQDFFGKNVKSIILDLRATPAGGDFDMAAEVLKRFSPKGKLLFTVKKLSAKQERIVTSSVEPIFHGLIVVLVDKDTGGAGEVIAAALRINANAMVVGSDTAGQSVEYSDIPLSGGKILRVAVAEVVLPGNISIFSKGIKPDIAVDMPHDVKLQVMQLGLDKGVSQLVFETERTHMNEAALVARTNPEIDAIQASQRLKVGGLHAPVHDAVLQRAVDLITSIGIYQTKPPEK